MRATVLAVAVAGAAAASAASLDVKATPNTTRLTPYQVFELTLQHRGKVADPTWDVTIDVAFTSPGGKALKVGGFFYGSSQPQKPTIRERTDGRGRKRSSATWPCDPADLWMARYAPSELGRWAYQWRFRTKAGGEAAGKGELTVVRGRVRPKGWVRIDPRNPFRFVFEDGSPFFPVGWQDGVFDNNHNGSAMDAKSMEGPFRLDRANQRPKPPAGAMFVRGPSMNPVNGDVYFGRHARAGFNLWRFSPHNFSLPVFDIDYDLKRPTPARIRWEQARMVDEMLRMNRKYGVRIFYGIFGFAKVFNQQADDERAMAKVRAVVKYSVDRWGAFVDFWELLNEQKASDGWYKVAIPYLKSIDPYGKPVATSWERPELDGIDVSAPHWYGRENELSSDQASAGRARSTKRFGKPVVYGEQGNGGGKPHLIPQGIGGVWDPGSARRMRVRLWSALFTEISFVFWETSYARDGHHMNLWVGPEERQYVRALQDFAHRLDAGLRMAPVKLSGPQARGVRAYGLRSGKRAAVYVHHVACAQCKGDSRSHRWDHDRGEVRGLQLTLDVPQAAAAYWYDPRTAAILATADVAKGNQTLTAPPFTIDLALLVTEAGPPDIDGDGQPNHADPDDDNDGVPDAKDAWPLEREETADADGDRIGDSLDADVDADGKPDDLNKNGVPDTEETDRDGDGVPNASAVPWDAFPRDPKEWRDTDGDGIGDNADPDDDGDGWSDGEEKQAGTDPLNAVSFPEKGARGPAGPSALSVMSYNIRYQSMDGKRERDGKLHPWDGRKHAVAAAIAQKDPDILGLQEAQTGQRRDLARALRGYEAHSTILWKRDKLAKLGGGSQKLPGSGRSVAWVRLQWASAGRELFVFNTHFPPALKEPQKVKLCTFVADLINQTAGADGLAILTGDLNIHDNDSKGIQILRDRAKLSDPWTDTGTPQKYTWNFWFRPTWSGNTVDWILYRRPLRALRVERPAYTDDGEYPSDHLPVYAPLAGADGK